MRTTTQDSWANKFKAFSENKKKRLLDAAKAKEQYQKELQKFNDEQQKLKEQNASASERMAANWARYKEQAVSAFAGNSTSNLTTPGQGMPSFPKKPEAQNSQLKVASVLSNIGSENIQRMIKHASQMHKLNNLIKYVEFAEDE